MLLNNDTLQQHEAQIDARSKALVTTIEKGEKTISEAKAKLDAELAAQLKDADGAQRPTIRAIMGKQHSKTLSQLRAEVNEGNAEQRQGILAIVDKIEADIASTEPLFTNARQVLSREGLGEERRTQLQLQLAQAGPAELQSMADLALAQGDRILAAAVLATAERDTKRYSQFDSAAFAEKVTGEETKAMQKRLATLKGRLESMRQFNTAHERTGELSPRQKIELGIAQRALKGPTVADRDAIAGSLR